MAVYLPLRGPGADDPKAPGVSGWNAPDWKWSPMQPHNGWIGLRADGLVIIDCDSLDALKLWFKEDGDAKATNIVKTPRGFHCYYRWDGEPLGPRTAIFGPGSHVDLRSGPGAYVVCPPTPGYKDLDEGTCPADWNPDWYSPSRARGPIGEGWEFVPEGQRNDFLARIGGSLRAAGANKKRIAQMLHGLNNLVCNPPLPGEEVAAVAVSVSRYEPDVEYEWDDSDTA